jgi:hypothetical protein
MTALGQNANWSLVCGESVYPLVSDIGWGLIAPASGPRAASAINETWKRSNGCSAES